MPSSQRFSRQDFKKFLENKGIFVVFNRLGTFKYLPATKMQISVVTSSKAQKSAVRRNKVRRRIYETLRAQKPQIQGIVYVSKQSYDLTYTELKTLLEDLVARTSKASK